MGALLPARIFQPRVRRPQPPPVVEELALAAQETPEPEREMDHPPLLRPRPMVAHRRGNPALPTGNSKDRTLPFPRNEDPEPLADPRPEPSHSGTCGEPGAVRVARRVRRAAWGNGPGAIPTPRPRSTPHLPLRLPEGLGRAEQGSAADLHVVDRGVRAGQVRRVHREMGQPRTRGTSSCGGRRGPSSCRSWTTTWRSAGSSAPRTRSNRSTPATGGRSAREVISRPNRPP